MDGTLRVLHVCYCTLIERKFEKADKKYVCLDTRCRNKEAHILCPINFGCKLDYALCFNSYDSGKQHICFARPSILIFLPCNGAVCRCKIRHIFFIPGEQINPLLQDKTPTSTNKKWHKQHCERFSERSPFFTCTL